MARKRRRNKNRLLKFKLRTIALTKITVACLAIALAGNWIVETFGGEFKTMLDLNSLKDDVKVESYEPERNDSYVPPTTDDVEDEKTNEDMDLGLIADNEEVIISSDLLDDGYDFTAIDFNQLNEVNPEIDGWITIDGTTIDYPIVQGQTNDEYLRTNYRGQSDNSGSIFIDYRNNPLTSPQNDLSDITIIYGHHMSGGRMFAPLCNYKSQSYYDNHKIGIIYTEDGLAFELEFFAGVIVDGSNENILFTNDFIDENQFNNYFSNILDYSTFDSDVEVEYGDDIVALVTCSYETDNSRYVLYARINKQIINENQRDMVTQERSLRLN